MGFGMGILQVIEADGRGGLTIDPRPFVVMTEQTMWWIWERSRRRGRRRKAEGRSRRRQELAGVPRALGSGDAKEVDERSGRRCPRPGNAFYLPAQRGSDSIPWVRGGDGR